MDFLTILEGRSPKSNRSAALVSDGCLLAVPWPHLPGGGSGVHSGPGRQAFSQGGPEPTSGTRGSSPPRQASAARFWRGDPRGDAGAGTLPWQPDPRLERRPAPPGSSERERGLRGSCGRAARLRVCALGARRGPKGGREEAG